MKDQEVRLLLQEAEESLVRKSQDNDCFVTKGPSRVAMLCWEAHLTKKPDLVAALIRSDQPSSREDRADIADFYAGKFNNRRGRPVNVDNQSEMEFLADMVSELKHIAR